MKQPDYIGYINGRQKLWLFACSGCLRQSAVCGVPLYMESSLVPTIIGLYGVTTSLPMFPEA